MSSTRKFWPLDDYDPDGEIYDNVSWDLPGFRGGRRAQPQPSRLDRVEEARYS